MNRILSAVFVTVGAVLLVWVLVVSLRPRHQVETPTPETKVLAATTAFGVEQPTGAAFGVPTLAPPRPTTLEAENESAQGVVYVTVEVEPARPAAQ